MRGGRRGSKEEWEVKEEDEWEASKMIWHEANNRKKGLHFGKKVFSS